MMREQTLMDCAESVIFTVYLDDQKEDKVNFSVSVYTDSMIEDDFK